jgi:hypothetical protein
LRFPRVRGFGHFECCLLARNVFGGITYDSQVHQGASTDIIMERRDEIREIL